MIESTTPSHRLIVGSAHHLPVLVEADAVLAGGSLGNCLVAQQLASAGQRVVLVTGSCSLPHQLSVCRRAWLSDQELDALPGPWRDAWGQTIIEQLPDGSHLLNLAQLAIATEDLLLDAGVQLFYGQTACGRLLDDAGKTAGVVTAGKAGLLAIPARVVIDSLPLHPLIDSSSLSRSVRLQIVAKVNELDSAQVDPQSRQEELQAPTRQLAVSQITVSACPALADGIIRIHGPYASMTLQLEADPGDPLAGAKLLDASRRQLYQIGCRVRQQREDAGLPPIYFHRFSGGMLLEEGQADPFVEASLRYCPAGADLIASAKAARQLTADLIADLPQPGRPASVQLGQPANDPAAPDLTDAELCFQDSSLLHGLPRQLSILPQALPMLGSYDVIVAGGGTSGVPAALAAARAGARTCLLEQHDDVGGVHTVGGVGSYWFGREIPFQTRYNEACDSHSRAAGMATEIGMRRCLQEAGVTVLSGVVTAAVLRRKSKLPGVVIASSRGLGILKGGILIDATGDADLAAWAGAPCAYGNGRDAWTMWASFANFNAVRKTASRQYESALDVRDPHDFTRTVLMGRRRPGMWRRHPHEMPQHYAAPRESRRLQGQETMTYGGILSDEPFADLMTVCESNFDIKGIATSDLICSGLIWSWRTRKTFQAALPYRAALPRGIDNVLVAGRAYSATHDALALARMQRDMGCMGASLGIAAAISLREGQELMHLDTQDLQAAWVAAGTLLESDLRRFAAPRRSYGPEEASRDVDVLLNSGDQWQRRLARLAANPEHIDVVRDGFRRAPSGAMKLKLARLLGYFGDREPVSYLLQQIDEQLSRGLPRPYRKTLAMPPEHGWAGEPVYSLYALAMAGAGSEAVPRLERIADLVPEGQEIYADKRDSPFEYVRVVAAVAERQPGAAMVPPLRTLLAKPSLQRRWVHYLEDPRQALDPVSERCAYLELALSRALARCGEAEGYERLIAYTDDVRGAIARSAVDELVELLGCRPAGTTEEWQYRLAQVEPLPLLPYTCRLD